MKTCRGFTLLEALIGFLVLAVGMLGVASLQGFSLKAGKSSVYGSVAIMKVDELFESMRVNSSALASYTGSGSNLSCTGAKNCTANQLAQDDVFWWKKNLKAGLPDDVTTTVSLAPAAAPSKVVMVTIEIKWKERNWSDTTDGADTSVEKVYASVANICTGVPC